MTIYREGISAVGRLVLELRSRSIRHVDRIRHRLRQFHHLQEVTELKSKKKHIEIPFISYHNREMVLPPVQEQS